MGKNQCTADQDPTISGLPAFTRRAFSRALLAAGVSMHPLRQTLLPPSGTFITVDPGAFAYLMADEAQKTASLKVRTDETHGMVKRFWVQGWQDPEQVFTWPLMVRQAGAYEVTLMINAPAESEVEVSGPMNTIRVVCKAAQPEYPGLNWNRITLTEPLELPAGSSAISIRLLHSISAGHDGAALKSIELLNSAARAAMNSRIQALRSDTSWLNKAKFGLMCQCGEWSYPRHGPHKPWPAMVDQFDVDKYAAMVASTGAGYAVWSATWATYFFPGPIKAIDRILPGRTSERDLIGEIAAKLAKRDIRLILYYHAGHGDPDWWSRNWTTPTDKSLFVRNWCAIMEEVGARYGTLLAGWMFDDDLVYYPAPYEQMCVAAKTGNPSRIISYNPWIQPRGTDFQDFQFGEGFTGSTHPPASAEGIWLSGPQKGLHAHGNFQIDGPDWGISKADTVIQPPHLTPEKAMQIALGAASQDVALSWNLLMYDDGSVSEQSLSLLQQVGQAVRKQYPVTKV